MGEPTPRLVQLFRRHVRPPPADRVVPAREGGRVGLGQEATQSLAIDPPAVEHRGPEEHVEESELLGADRRLVRPDRVMETGGRLERHLGHPARLDEAGDLLDRGVGGGLEAPGPDLGPGVEAGDRGEDAADVRPMVELEVGMDLVVDEVEDRVHRLPGRRLQFDGVDERRPRADCGVAIVERLDRLEVGGHRVRILRRGDQHRKRPERRGLPFVLERRHGREVTFGGGLEVGEPTDRDHESTQRIGQRAGPVPGEGIHGGRHVEGRRREEPGVVDEFVEQGVDGVHHRSPGCRHDAGPEIMTGSRRSRRLRPPARPTRR